MDVTVAIALVPTAQLQLTPAGTSSCAPLQHEQAWNPKLESSGVERRPAARVEVKDCQVRRLYCTVYVDCSLRPFIILLTHFDS